MFVLGIESTAHTFGIGICNEKGDILANEYNTYVPKSGGIIPAEAAKHHIKVKRILLKKALKKAKLSLADLDLIVFSQGPGLSPCLVVGRDFALELAKKNKKSVIGVNHCVAHIEIGLLFNALKNPIIGFFSGANSQIVCFAPKYKKINSTEMLKRKEKYIVIGETLDSGLGNSLDKLGRQLNLPFPAGPKIEELAKTGKYIELPYTVKGMNFAFAGLVTSAINKYKQGSKIEDVCFSFQETAFAEVVEVCERALSFSKSKELLFVGGVAANQRLQQMFKIMCLERGAKFYTVSKKFAGDNGAMIAWAGLKKFKKERKTKNLDIRPTWRIDQK
ncbi:MAG: UGMP family protein [Candidatus Huberarchaeum crystalense]|uniref:N(6)-L-threonylcarbamoyladenine synthase n=1 Tax=Huberarchaeum crystalense TaxID=2014257 RepID=A0A2G9LJH7_HUBC1|nr:tRNA (adenosine(37)-N6)-threonylcarbamoyltransferase complex transferase subunit TsaD [archaeon]OIP20603.1 MAG: UGMP family protein [archaeon CG2_30_31_98]PIN66703.1 MAG: UGMP family protein [Candidatus Huberarchaeum crystalense]NCS98454.1 tRNA (adenosine(37)-N6)-threonylcarbamoyltransferase complex transferase subunit TsaD [archaeon]PIV13536.1 MAG: UGMP family protein [Candidatus Huberarchaeum crystalense]